IADPIYITIPLFAAVAAVKGEFQRGDRVFLVNKDTSFDDESLRGTAYANLRGTISHIDGEQVTVKWDDGTVQKHWTWSIGLEQKSSQFTAAFAHELVRGTRVWSQTRGPKFLGTVEKVKRVTPPDGMPRKNEQAQATVKWDDGGMTQEPEWQLALAQKKLQFTAAAPADLVRGTEVTLRGNPKLRGFVKRGPRDDTWASDVVVEWNEHTLPQVWESDSEKRSKKWTATY